MCPIRTLTCMAPNPNKLKRGWRFRARFFHRVATTHHNFWIFRGRGKKLKSSEARDGFCFVLLFFLLLVSCVLSALAAWIDWLFAARKGDGGKLQTISGAKKKLSLPELELDDMRRTARGKTMLYFFFAAKMRTQRHVASVRQPKHTWRLHFRFWI